MEEKPTLLIYCLQSLQGKFCNYHFLIYLLKLLKKLDSFIFKGEIFQILGPK